MTDAGATLSMAEWTARGKAAPGEDPSELSKSVERVVTGHRLIACYLGNADTFGRSILELSKIDADQIERADRALVDALDFGRVAAQTGL